MIKSNGYSNGNKLVVLKNSQYINAYHATGLFYTPKNHQKTRELLVFSYRKTSDMKWVKE